jgi:hypothetical protein
MKDERLGNSSFYGDWILVDWSLNESFAMDYRDYLHHRSVGSVGSAESGLLTLRGA